MSQCFLVSVNESNNFSNSTIIVAALSAFSLIHFVTSVFLMVITISSHSVIDKDHTTIMNPAYIYQHL